MGVAWRRGEKGSMNGERRGRLVVQREKVKGCLMGVTEECGNAKVWCRVAGVWKIP